MLNIKNMSLVLLLVSASVVSADNSGALTVRVSQVDFSSAGTDVKKEFVPKVSISQGGMLTEVREQRNTFKELQFGDFDTFKHKEEFDIISKNRDIKYSPKKLLAPEATFLDKLISKLCADQVGAMKDVIINIGKVLSTDYESADTKLVALIESFDGFCTIIRKYKESVVPLIKESCDDATVTALEITLINPRTLLEQYASSSEDTLTFFKRELQGDKEVQVKELGRAIKQLILDVLRSWPLSMRAWKKIQNQG